LALLALLRRRDRAFFKALPRLDFPFTEPVTLLEPFLPAAFSTMAKIRFFLDSDTPRCDANVVADFLRKEIVTDLDIADSILSPNLKITSEPALRATSLDACAPTMTSQSSEPGAAG
jgi:hypothetical protein